MEIASVTMTYDSEKKHSHLYKATAPDAALQGIYLMKKGIANPSKPPKKIVVRIGSQDEE